MIRLGRTDNGKLIMGSNQPLPSDVERVEYYRDQKLFNLVFEDDECEDMLMNCEMSRENHELITVSPDMIIVAMVQDGEEPYEYIAPLVQIGF